MVKKLIEEIKDSIKDFFKRQWDKFKYIIVLIIFVILIFLIVKFDRVEPEIIDSQEIKIFGITLENIGQWIAIIYCRMGYIPI